MEHIEDTYLLVFTVLFPAVCWDLRTGKIPNWLVAIGLCLGLGYRMAEKGPGEAVFFFLDAFWPIALLYIFFYIKAIGAGDIKLFSVISTFLPPGLMIKVIIVSFFVGAGVACYRIIKNREVYSRTKCLYDYVLLCAQSKKILYYSTLNKKSSYIKFSACIFLGYAGVYLGELLG